MKHSSCDGSGLNERLAILLSHVFKNPGVNDLQDVCFTKALCLAAALVISLAGNSQAASFASTLRANFTFTTVKDNPLGFPGNMTLQFTAIGALTFSLDDSLPNATSMDFTGANSNFTVSAPSLFSDATMRPYKCVSGQLKEIVRKDGNITGGNVSDLRMKWQMLFPTPGGLARRYTKDSLPFNGAVTGAPFGIGDQISSPEKFDVYLDMGRGEKDPLAVIGSNRVLTVTPEPTSLAIFGLSGLALAWRSKFRKSRIPVN